MKMDRAIRMNFKVERRDDGRHSAAFVIARAAVIAISALYFLYISYEYYAGYSAWLNDSDAITVVQGRIEGHERNLRNFRIFAGRKTEEVVVTSELRDALAKLSSGGAGHSFRKTRIRDAEIFEDLMGVKKALAGDLAARNITIGFSEGTMSFLAECASRRSFARLPGELKGLKWVDSVFVENSRTGASGTSGTVTLKLKEDAIYE